MARARRGREHWAKIIAQWRESGLAMAAYCRRRDVSYVQLGRWRRRIERAAVAKPLTLIPVVAAAPSGGAMVLRLPGGASVELARGFDPVLLAAVVHALAEPVRC